MRAFAAVVLVVACATTSSARVKVGENLIYNGTLDGDQVEFPDGWAERHRRLSRADGGGVTVGKRLLALLAVCGRCGIIANRFES